VSAAVASARDERARIGSRCRGEEEADMSQVPPAPKTRPRKLDDDALLDLVQRQTFRYFWDFAHPVSGLARERSNVRPDYGHETVTTGGSGFGVMSILVAAERGWIARQDACDRLLRMVRFLLRADSYHGILPHFLHGETGRTIPFTRKDDGGDLVETSFLIKGLLCARQYFDRVEPDESELRARVDRLWEEVEWDWHTRGGEQVLYWHWSPNNGWAMNHRRRAIGSTPRSTTGASRRAGPSPTAASSTASGCRSGPTTAARCSSRTIRFWAWTRAACATAMPTTGSRTSRTA
jgi:hypothetical protein